MTALSVVGGAAVPLVILAALIRWRVAEIARRAARTTVRRRQARPRTGRGGGLGWIRGTFAPTAPPIADLDDAASALACTYCEYVNEAGALFCRRCGQRMRREG